MESDGAPICVTCWRAVGKDDACGVCSYPVCGSCVEEDIRDGKGRCSRCGAPYSLAQEDLKDDHDDQSKKELAMTAYSGDNQDEGLHAQKFNYENGNPIWKSRVESWKEKKNNKKTTQKKEAKPARVPQVQQMDGKEYAWKARQEIPRTEMSRSNSNNKDSNEISGGDIVYQVI